MQNVKPKGFGSAFSPANTSRVKLAAKFRPKSQEQRGASQPFLGRISLTLGRSPTCEKIDNKVSPDQGTMNKPQWRVAIFNLNSLHLPGFPGASVTRFLPERQQPESLFYSMLFKACPKLGRTERASGSGGREAGKASMAECRRSGTWMNRDGDGAAATGCNLNHHRRDYVRTILALLHT